MAHCSMCGAELQEGTNFCPICGASITGQILPESNLVVTTQNEFTERSRGTRKKPIFRRWWFWILVLVLIGSVVSRQGSQRAQTTPARNEGASVTVPSQTGSSEQAPGPTPAKEPTSPTIAENEIHPEFKEFLDSYEACMDEYVAFMHKYSKADPSDMAAMMTDYYAMMSRYGEFSEKIDNIDERELTSAELAYYLEVVNRVNQKLLTVSGG